MNFQSSILSDLLCLSSFLCTIMLDFVLLVIIQVKELKGRRSERKWIKNDQELAKYRKQVAFSIKLGCSMLIIQAKFQIACRLWHEFLEVVAWNVSLEKQQVGSHSLQFFRQQLGNTQQKNREHASRSILCQFRKQRRPESQPDLI